MKAVSVRSGMNIIQQKIQSMGSESLRNKLDPVYDIDVKNSEAESESARKTLKAGRRIKADQVGPADPDQHIEKVEEGSKQMQIESVPEKMSSEVVRKREKARASVGCTNSDCSKIGSQRCAGCHWSLYCEEVSSQR